MKSEWQSQWECMTVDELFTLRKLMHDVLSSKLKAKKAELERRLQELNPPPKSRPTPPPGQARK